MSVLNISFTEWDEVDHVLWGGSQTPYYIIGIRHNVALQHKPLKLNAGTLNVGDRIAYIGGYKTSAGFSELHPVAPVLFEYKGIFSALNGNRYVIWGLVNEETDEEIPLPPNPATTTCNVIYYAHALLQGEDMADTRLIYTNRAGAGRIIETDLLYRNRKEIPKELYPKEYQ